MTAAAPATWQGVRDEVQRRIRSGQWRPGDAIPNEADLARELGCARATVNRALRDLAAAGLLTRKRKAGTRVALNPVRRAVLRIPLLRDEIVAAGLGYGYRLIGAPCRAAPAPAAAALGIAPGSPARQVTALHLGDGKSFVLEERWINLQAVPAAAEADFAAVSANEWLVRNVPFSEGSLCIAAMSADPRTARLLDCQQGAALVRLTRETWDGATRITRAELTYRPGHTIRSLI